MKGTDQFKQVIEAHLKGMAENDAAFAAAFAKPEKNMNDCVTYILNEVKKSGCNGFADDEIYGMAVHYYQEDNINVGKPLRCDVRVNHAIAAPAVDKKPDQPSVSKAKAPAKPKRKVIQTTMFDLFGDTL
jgi:hypothetical protein